MKKNEGEREVKKKEEKNGFSKDTMAKIGGGEKNLGAWWELYFSVV